MEHLLKQRGDPTAFLSHRSVALFLLSLESLPTSAAFLSLWVSQWLPDLSSRHGSADERRQHGPGAYSTVFLQAIRKKP